jgi:hypothetical protein
MSVLELEKAIAQLPAEELSQFAKWFEDYEEERSYFPSLTSAQA